MCKKLCFSPHPLQHLLFVDFLLVAILISVKSNFIEVLVCISLIINYVEHLFMCLMAICMSLERHLFMFSAHFCLGCLFFWCWAPWAVLIFWSLILSWGRYCCWNLASLHWHRVETWRQSSDWSRKWSLYFFAKQREIQQTNALKTVSHLGGAPGESHGVQGAGRDQFVNILLIFWWWGNQGVSVINPLVSIILRSPACLGVA